MEQKLENPPPSRRQFASDNYSGICPEAWETLAAANAGHASPYGNDAWTEQACDALRELFETDCEVYFVSSGTAANALALSSLCQSYHSILCHEAAHVETDECGAAEFFSNGTKVLVLPGEHGKVRPQFVEQAVSRRSDIHYPKPRVLTVSQATELGTVYSIAELAELGQLCRRLGVQLHMDGARAANALATLNVAPKEMTWKIGVDVICFGGAKNGLPIGEAVVFFRKEAAEEFAYRCKQAGQLTSKMRFMAAPWLGLLKSGAWLENARRANRSAELLERELRSVPGLEILHPRQANAVFVHFPTQATQELRRRGWSFYEFIGGGARLMCSWDTTENDVRAIGADIRQVLSGPTVA
ncbi:MAG TPA: low specificity L-threonine aldolase [Pirellulales bacterium]